MFDGPRHSCRWKRWLPWALHGPQGLPAPSCPPWTWGWAEVGKAWGGVLAAAFVPEGPRLSLCDRKEAQELFAQSALCRCQGWDCGNPPSRDHRADMSAPLETRPAVCAWASGTRWGGQGAEPEDTCWERHPPLMVVGGEVAQESRRGEEQWAPQWDVTGLHQVLGVRGWWVCCSQSLENLQGPQWYGSFSQWYSCLAHKHQYFHRNNSVSLACVLNWGN